MVKRTILVAVGFACSVVVSGNVVSNSGFEEVNADGSLKGIRNTGNLFRRDPSGGVGGSAALMYENADSKTVLGSGVGSGVGSVVGSVV